MRLTPISAEEANANAPTSGFEPLPPGEYEFSVRDADETVSKAGNPQIKLTLEILRPGQSARVVFDYLGASAGMQWKVRHFAESVDMLRHYERGDLDPAVMVGRFGRVRLKIEKQEGYEATNKVGDYIPVAMPKAPVRTQPPAPNPVSERAQRTVAAGGIDDEIPF